MTNQTDARKPKAKPRGRGRPRGSSAEKDVLETADRPFAENGFHACTVEHILEASGVSRRNFYRFFSGKDEVFRKIFLSKTAALERLADAFDQQTDDAADARFKLELMFEMYLRGNFAVGALLPVLIHEAQAVPEYREVREQVMAKFRQTITTILGPWAAPTVNDLLLDGCLVAIERMVLVKSRQRGDSEKMIQDIKNACLEFVPILIDPSANVSESRK